jgi:hypothetical protein
MRDAEASVEKEHNAILLEYALRKESEQIAREEAKKHANREASLKYKKFLEEQMVKEAEDTAFLDDVRKREEEKVLWICPAKYFIVPCHCLSTKRIVI